MFNRTAIAGSAAASRVQSPVVNPRQGASSFYDAPDPYEAGKRAGEADEAANGEEDPS